MPEDGEDRISLQDASWTYRVPIATLRYWLDKGELTRHRDEAGHVFLSVAEVERKLHERAQDARRRTQGA